ILSSNRDQDGWLPLTRGGREGRVRSRQGGEGRAGTERAEGRNLEKSRTAAEARPEIGGASGASRCRRGAVRSGGVGGHAFPLFHVEDGERLAAHVHAAGNAHARGVDVE